MLIKIWKLTLSANEEFQTDRTPSITEELATLIGHQVEHRRLQENLRFNAAETANHHLHSCMYFLEMWPCLIDDV